MEQEKLIEILNYISQVDCSDEQKRLMLEMAANTITVEKLGELISPETKPQVNIQNKVGIFKFTNKEILKMPKGFRKEFRTAGCSAHILRRRSGKNSWNYLIRYRRNGYNIAASSNNLEEAKRKFIEKLCQADEIRKQQDISAVTGEILVSPAIVAPKPQITQINGIPAMFDKFANYYFEKFHKRKVCEETYRITLSNYKNHVLPHFGNVPLSSITPDKCQKLLDRLIEEDKVRTEENIFTMLNTLFTAAVKHGVMQHNPMDMVFHTKHEREHGKALTKEEEIKLLADTAETPYQTMFAVALYTGLRPNEYKTARIEGEFIVANNSKRKNGKVELKKIPISPKLKPYLDGVSEFKFFRLEQMRNRLKAIFPDHKLYDLRTTFYTRCQECGVAQVAINTYVGHSLGGLADTYTDLSDEFLIEESKKLDY